MLKSYFIIFSRNLLKNKVYTLINISGLAIGITCCMIITLYLQHELSYDKFHKHADNIIRVTEITKSNALSTQTAHTYSALGPAITNEIPEVVAVTRFFNENTLVDYGDTKRFQEPDFFYSDSTVFDIFSFRVIKGELSSALNEPFTLVLTSSMAEKYFGDDDPIDKIVKINDDHDFRITAIIEDPPIQSQLQVDFLASFSSLKNIQGGWMYNNWYYPPMYTYARLKPASNIDSMDAKLIDLVGKYLGPGEMDQRILAAQPLLDIHTSSGLENEWGDNLPLTYVFILGSTGFLILLIACINYMNLSIATALPRIKEIALRKVVGAAKKQLVQQFLMESVALAMLAAIIAFALNLLLLPIFNIIAGVDLTAAAFQPLILILFFILLPVIVGIVSGWYPTAILVTARTNEAIKGSIKSKNAFSSGLGKSLVVFQFIITISLIVSTLIINKQLKFLKHKNLGFDKEHVVVVYLRDGNDSRRYPTLKQRLVSNPQIVEVSSSSRVPGKGRLADYNIRAEGQKHRENLVFYVLNTSFDIEKTLGLTIVDGRSFDINMSTDSSGIIINESAVEKLGWENPINRKIEIGSLGQDGNFQPIGQGNVIGVVKNFNYNSLHQKIDPMMITIGPAYMNNFLSIRIQGNDVAHTLSFIEKEWLKFSPDRTFEYFFLDQNLNQLYQHEERLSKIFLTFSMLSILIACLGLFAMASYTTKRKSKEIGIRKIAGASSKNVLILLMKEFLSIALLSIIIAGPLSYLGLSKWLNNFAYQVEISLEAYFVGAIICFVVMLITVGYQTIKAAGANPVQSLRNE